MEAGYESLKIETCTYSKLRVIFLPSTGTAYAALIFVIDIDHIVIFNLI